MAFLEGNWLISAQEYDDFRSKRIKEGDLDLDQIYTVMMKVVHAKREAAKLTARLVGKRRESSLITIALQFLDSDLNPRNTAEGTIANGFIDGLEKNMTVHDVVNNKERLSIDEVYLRDYDDDGLGLALELDSYLSLSV
jgi:hypothetical protein